MTLALCLAKAFFISMGFLLKRRKKPGAVFRVYCHSTKSIAASDWMTHTMRSWPSNFFSEIFSQALQHGELSLQVCCNQHQHTLSLKLQLHLALQLCLSRAETLKLNVTLAFRLSPSWLYNSAPPWASSTYMTSPGPHLTAAEIKGEKHLTWTIMISFLILSSCIKMWQHCVTYLENTDEKTG